MMVAHYDPIHGWSAPEIKPYAPLSIDPASSCLQYATNVFEGMKVRIHILLPVEPGRPVFHFETSRRDAFYDESSHCV